MKNSEIARVFHDMADLLELKEDNVFKIRAYRRAAQVIEHLPKEMAVMLEQGEDFQKIPGVGDAIAKKSTELIKTGKLEAYESLKDEFPEGITRLLEIPGIGPKTAHLLSSELKITSAEQLEEAIQEGRVADLFRMGDKTAQNLLHKIEAMRRKDQRVPIGQALPIVEDILNSLSSLPGVKNMISAGSLRRFRETVGDIDIMGTADNPEKVINEFVALPVVKEVLAKGPTKASVILSPGLQADLRMVEHDSFGSLLQYFTGSKEHNIALRTKYQKKGLKLSEYGITDVAHDKLEKFATEEAFYKRLPSLDSLDLMNARTVTLGWVFLTVGVVVGVIWAIQAKGGPIVDPRIQAMSLADPKILGAVVSWTIYTFALYARKRGFGGKRAAYISVIGFAIVLFNFVPIGYFLTRSHNFGG